MNISLRSKSFSVRLTRRVVLVMLVTMSFISGLIFIWATVSMGMMSKAHYHDVLDITNQKVGKIMTAVEVAAINNVSEIERNLDSPERVFAAMKGELELNPHVIGCGLAFIPDYYPQQGHWFEPYVVRHDNGEIESLQIGSASHDYLKSEWYLKAMTEEGGYWSNPYYDAHGAKAMLCTYSKPVRDAQGRIVAVFGADVSLDWLKDQLHEIDKSERQNFFVLDSTDRAFAPYSFIIGRKGDYIVHPDEHRILHRNYMEEAKYTNSDGDDNLGILMRKGQSGQEIVDVDGITSYVFYAPLEQSGWAMAIVVPAFTIFFMGILVGCITLLLLFIGLMVVFHICHVSIRRATLPLKQLSVSADEVAKGNFHTQLPVIEHDDEIKLLRDSFDTMQHSLSQYVKQLTTTTAQKAAIESELHVARSIQMSMLPKTFPPFPERSDIDIFGKLTPAKAVGGDLFDFYLNDNQLFFCVGDVSGKGVPASLVMAVARSLFRNISAHTAEPNRIMGSLNEALADGNENNMFVTLFMGVLNLENGCLSYCNAGHNEPILISDNVQFMACDPNLPAGIELRWDFTLQETQLTPGTTLFIYTDGLNEAENAVQEQFGDNRMLAKAGELLSKSLSAEQIVNEMTEAVHRFVGDAEPSDDMTMLAIQYKGK